MFNIGDEIVYPMHGAGIIVDIEEKKILGESYQIGHTPQYVKVAYKTDKNLSNEIINGKVTKLLKDDILLMED